MNFQLCTPREACSALFNSFRDKRNSPFLNLAHRAYLEMKTRQERDPDERQEFRNKLCLLSSPNESELKRNLSDAVLFIRTSFVLYIAAAQSGARFQIIR